MNKQVVKVRATAHRGRAGKHGAYNPKHNDRNFDVRKSDHIDIAKSNKNLYWHCYRQTMPNITFEDAESRFYEEHFGDALSQKNARYIKNRHKERVQTMDEYRMSDRYCPEEILYQLGEVGQQRPSSNTLIQIINEFNFPDKDHAVFPSTHPWEFHNAGKMLPGSHRHPGIIPPR